MFAIPLYVTVGLVLCALNLLLFYVALRRRDAIYIIGAQGALAGFISSLPVIDSFTYVWVLTVSMLFFLVVCFTLVFKLVRARFTKSAKVSS